MYGGVWHQSFGLELCLEHVRGWFVMGSMAGLRTRWAAIGAACAVVLGAGGFGVVSAAVSSGDRAIYVPVTPIRVLDTRSSEKVLNETVRLVIEGVITTADGVSRQVVPTDASAVAINITATSTRKNGDYGYVTVFPCTADTETAPNASSLNFENGVDIANALNVTTSANGSICLYVYGTADLLVDVAGYYADHNHDDRYYSKADVDAALARINTALADKADTDDIDTALNGINTALAGKEDRCVITSCVVGDVGPGGGIIFYKDLNRPAGSQYFEVACAGWQNNCDGTTADPLYEWGCRGKAITGADGTLIGTGEQNTADIVKPVTGCPTAGIAARIADDLVLGGRSDWFLPSIGESILMYTNLYNVSPPLGGFSCCFYWSSSEGVYDYAWLMMFDDGFQASTTKDFTLYVRPVRAF